MTKAQSSHEQLCPAVAACVIGLVGGASEAAQSGSAVSHPYTEHGTKMTWCKSERQVAEAASHAS